MLQLQQEILRVGITLQEAGVVLARLLSQVHIAKQRFVQNTIFFFPVQRDVKIVVSRICHFKIQREPSS